MLHHLRAAIVLFAGLTVLTGIAYPLAVTAAAQGLFPWQANGSRIVRDGKLVGSALIGQSFDDARYFWGRPSATLPPYDGGASSGSNLGPTNPAMIDAVRQRVAAARAAHPDQTGPVPADLVTASASGLDPHISPAAAKFQVARVAAARGLSPDAIRRIVAAHTEDSAFGVLGEPRVNVLRLNLALDGMTEP